jgi:hypothetical protein
MCPALQALDLTNNGSWLNLERKVFRTAICYVDQFQFWGTFIFVGKLNFSQI